MYALFPLPDTPNPLFLYRKFEELSESGEKVGEASKVLQQQLAALQAEEEDTSCGVVEEGQSNSETTDPSQESKD